MTAPYVDLIHAAARARAAATHAENRLRGARASFRAGRTQLRDTIHLEPLSADTRRLLETDVELASALIDSIASRIAAANKDLTAARKARQ